jgi:hypothetical protein
MGPFQFAERIVIIQPFQKHRDIMPQRRSRAALVGAKKLKL